MAAAAKLPHLQFDQVLTDHVVLSVTEVLKSTFAIQAKLVSVQLTRNYVSVGDISGITGMLQDRLEGNLVISFKKSVLGSILSRVYGKNLDVDGDIAKQGAGELTNMIYGRIKFQLNNNGFDLKMTLPSVVVGSGHSIHQQPGEQAAIYIFEFDEKYTFDVVIAIHD
jgi:chemotaxis protein CheX